MNMLDEGKAYEAGYDDGYKCAELDLAPKWIPVSESLPERHQRVMFVVKSDNEWYNGKVYGGVYTDPDFTTPGMGFEATHWMPLPDAP